MKRADCPSDQDLENLERVARQLPVRAFSDDEIDLLRTRVLASARVVQPLERRRPWPWMLPAAAAAAVVAVVVAVLASRSQPETPVEAPPEISRIATIRGFDAAVYEHRVATSKEIVELREGRIEIAIDPIDTERSFFVVTGDGAIELEGTAFEVTAREGRLVALAVIAGRAEMRRGEEKVSLATGDRWPKAPPPPPPEKKRAWVAAPAQADQAGAVDPVEVVERSFVEGIRRFKAGEYLAAADAFRTAAGDRSTPVAEDASYWLAVATLEAGKIEDAVPLMREFLERWPDSARSDEMTRMLKRVEAR